MINLTKNLVKKGKWGGDGALKPPKSRKVVSHDTFV